jgi:hypothetical protein
MPATGANTSSLLRRDKNDAMSWTPKLGDLFPKKPDDKGAAKRFEEAGFDLRQTLQQSPGHPGDKNNEERQLRFSRGPHMENPTTSQGSVIPPHVQTQIDAMRAEGATVGIPLVVQFGEKELAAIAARSEPVKPPSFGEDLARFSAKAGVATLLAAGGALAVWFVTKPSEPML